MEASPLMDQEGFVRELEGAYQAMWKKWCSTLYNTCEGIGSVTKCLLNKSQKCT